MDNASIVAEIDGGINQHDACRLCYTHLLLVPGFTSQLLASLAAIALRIGIEPTVAQAVQTWEPSEQEQLAIMLRGAIRHVLLRDAVLLN